MTTSLSDDPKMQQGEFFELAFEYASTQSHREAVRAMQADHYFEHGHFDLAARYYAKTHRCFEEVALKLSTCPFSYPKPSPLKLYLLEKLQALPVNDKTQRTILCLWIVEIFLSEMTELELLDDGPEATREMELEMGNFLSQYRSTLSVSECAETAFQLISSHGRVRVLLPLRN